jgi:hypothetical protein
MNIEENFVVSLIKGEDLTVFETIDVDKVVSILLEHKIFLHYYDTIIKLSIFKSDKWKLFSLHRRMVDDRKKYLLFFGQLNDNLAAIGIHYYIYKGLALEKIIYNNNETRMYSDIDIVLEEFSEYEKVRGSLYNEFAVIDDSTEKDAYICGEYKISVLFNNLVITVEFKNDQHYLILRDFNKPIYLSYNQTVFSTFSLETTFLNLINYFYHFTESIFSIQFSNRSLC